MSQSGTHRGGRGGRQSARGHREHSNDQQSTAGTASQSSRGRPPLERQATADSVTSRGGYRGRGRGRGLDGRSSSDDQGREQSRRSSTTSQVKDQSSTDSTHRGGDRGKGQGRGRGQCQEADVSRPALDNASATTLDLTTTQQRKPSSTGRRGMAKQSSSTAEVEQRRQHSADEVASGMDHLSLRVGSLSLSGRLKDMRLRRPDVKKNSEQVNELCELILARLRNSGADGQERLYPHSFAWEILRSGSYYEKVKISKPDEYDCLFTCTMRARVDLAGCPSNCYRALENVSGNAMDVRTISHIDGKDYICPLAFKELFRENILKVLQHESITSRYKIAVALADAKCPAVTLDQVSLCNDRDGIVFSIDLVPAVRLVEWPKGTESWKNCHVLRRDVKDNLPCVVPKIHPSEATNGSGHCRYWRLSFSAAEKFIVLHADGTHSKGETCRKDVLKLLKDDLEVYKQTHPECDICSFYLKTIFLHVLDEHPTSSEWRNDCLRERYVDALTMVVDCLKRKEILHYFVGENLLRMTHHNGLPEVTRHFKQLLKEADKK